MKIKMNIAHKMVQYAFENAIDGLRFGQVLWNSLPNELANHYVGSAHDFFYWKDHDQIVTEFYGEYVEQ